MQISVIPANAGIDGANLLKAPSERCAVEGNDELNAFHVFRVEAGIIGDEEVDAGGRGAGQLNGIGGVKRAIGTQRRVDSCRFHVEGKHDRGCDDGVLVFPGKPLISALEGLNENLAQGGLWGGVPHETPVFPAKAGIQSGASSFPRACGVDSRSPPSRGQASRECPRAGVWIARK